MNQREQRVDGGPWYREPWPWILMSGPAAVVIAGAVTAYLALTHPDPLVADNYYKEGLAINRVLERDHAATVAGYSAQVLFSEDGSRVRVHLSGRGALPRGLRLRMIHPTRAELDREAALTASQTGWYEGDLGAAPAPRWKLQLEDDERVWRLTGEWRRVEGGAIRLEPRG